LSYGGVIMAGVRDSNPYQKFGSFYAEPTAMTP